MVTLSSLFDGYDATIDKIGRIIQSTGAEVIHPSHNRSVQKILVCSVCEDVIDARTAAE